MFRLNLLPSSLRVQIRVCANNWKMAISKPTDSMDIRSLLARSENCSKCLKFPINAVCMSVRLPWKESVSTGRISMKFDIMLFFENPSRKFKFNSLKTKVNSYFHEDQYKFCVISHSFLLELQFIEQFKKHYLCSIITS